MVVFCWSSSSSAGGPLRCLLLVLFVVDSLNDADIHKWPVGVSIVPKGVNKAEGIKKYLELTNSNQEVFVFGDNLNDKEMFEAFYENSYVIGNAKDSVKGYAKNVMKNLEDDGIYWAVANILENGGKNVY